MRKYAIVRRGAQLLCALVVLAGAQAVADPKHSWLPSWTSAQQVPNFVFDPPPPALADTTLRQIVRVSMGGRAVRVWLTNELGTQPLTIGEAHVALRAAGSAIESGSNQPLTFDGNTEVVIAAGARVVSDPVRLRIGHLDELAISVHIPAAGLDAASPVSSHVRALQTSYVAPGNQAGDEDLEASQPVTAWYFLAAVDVLAHKAPVIAAIGDSITDGDQLAAPLEPVDRNERYTDLLAERILQRPVGRDRRGPGKRPSAVINLGISGNQVTDSLLGQSVEARLDRDVLARAGVTHLIVQGGINDIGLAVLLNTAGIAGLFGPDPRPLISAERIIAGLHQIAAQAQAHGIIVIGATISPAGGSALPGYSIDIPVPGGADEANAKREAVNHWIRTSGVFDRVADFDAALRDPDDPRLMRGDLTADGLHPNATGYAVMAEVAHVAVFGKSKGRKK